MKINKGARFRILVRDRFTCVYCGRKAPDVPLELDHLTPKSAGGPWRWDNIVTACFDCNRGKRDTILPDEVAAAFRVALPEPPRKRRRRRVYVQRVPERVVPHCSGCGEIKELEGDNLCICNHGPALQECKRCGYEFPADNGERCEDCTGYCLDESCGLYQVADSEYCTAHWLLADYMAEYERKILEDWRARQGGLDRTAPVGV